MDFAKNNVKLIDLAEPGRKIEYAGRVCYKSQDKISDGSYERFIKNIANSRHLSVFEHERKMFAIPVDVFSEKNYEIMFEFEHYFNITVNVNGNPSYIFVSGNIRAWYELLNGPKSIMYQEETKVLKNFLHKDYPYLFEINENEEVREDNIFYDLDAEKNCDDLSDHKAYTFEIVGSRSFTHQAVRSRSLSFSQESQRYCNYSGDKFNHSIKFIRSEGVDENVLKVIEDAYFKAIENGAKPEEARQILPNCTASTIVITGTLEDWKKFLHLRVDPHAQKEIREIAETIMSYLRLTKADIGLK
jgi:thymidylate synthase (FAD)